MESLFSIGFSEQWGTDKINQHPINQMFASKVHDLARMGLSDTDAFSKAYDECKKLAEENLEQENKERKDVSCQEVQDITC
jgi:hypothetical protein